MSPVISPAPLLAPAPERVSVQRRIQPAPAVDLSRMTRYRGGTYSHTVDTIVFADGTSARTDLIRLNPNIEAYSLDFTGIAPMRPSRYCADTWAAVPHVQARAHEAEVDWILRNSYPALSTTVLSGRLRAAGYPLGSRNIAEHEAIAGTQAAIWQLSNGLELDTTPRNVPTRISRYGSGLAVEFDGDRQIASYTVTVVTETGGAVRLQKSADGQAWDDVAASVITVAAGGGQVSRSLGVGTTLAHSRSDRHGGGHRHYRVVVDGDAYVADVSFRLHGAPLYRNAEPIVYLYEHLLAGARAAREAAVTPSLLAEEAWVGADGLVGPFRLRASSSAALAASGGHQVVGTDGSAIDRPVQPGEEFYVRASTASTGTTVIAKVPGESNGFGGRVITGVARDEVAGGYTPLALAVPAQLMVEFDIDWAG